jgi:hypothetical protein
MATKIIGYNIDQTSDPVIDNLRATSVVQTPLVTLLTIGSDLDITNRITSSNATSNDTSSANIRISSGKSRGSASGGNIIFQVSSAGTSGSTLNSYTDVAIISSTLFDVKNLSFAVNTDKFTVDRTTGNTSILGTLNVGSDITITGNLTVNGTTTTVNSTTLSVDDIEIEIGSVDTPTDITANGGGIRLKGLTDKTINWISSTSSWTSSENINLVTGKTYKIDGTDVLTSTQVLGKTPGGTSSGDIVTIDASQTLTNKSFSDSTTYFVDNSDATKRLQFELSGITSGQTRTITTPNSSGTLAFIDLNQTFTSSNTFQNSTGQIFRIGSSNDSIVIKGGSGTGGQKVEIISVDLTDDRTLTIPNVTGTIVTTGDTETVTNAMLAGSIENTKLLNGNITVNGTLVNLGGSVNITSSLFVPFRAGGVATIPTSVNGSNVEIIGKFRDGTTDFIIPIGVTGTP